MRLTLRLTSSMRLAHRGRGHRLPAVDEPAGEDPLPHRGLDRPPEEDDPAVEHADRAGRHLGIEVEDEPAGRADQPRRLAVLQRAELQGSPAARAEAEVLVSRPSSRDDYSRRTFMLHHRAVPRDRAQGPEPAVLRGQARPEPPARDQRPRGQGAGPGRPGRGRGARTRRPGRRRGSASPPCSASPTSPAPTPSPSTCPRWSRRWWPRWRSAPSPRSAITTRRSYKALPDELGRHRPRAGRGGAEGHRGAGRASRSRTSTSSSRCSATASSIRSSAARARAASRSAPRGG